MVRPRNRYLCIALAVGAVALTVAVWPRPCGGDPPRVRLAVNLPLSGPIAAFSGEYPNGLRMGLEDGCLAHGLPPETFELDIQDNQGKPSNAVTVLQKQSAAGFDVYCSGVSDMSVALLGTVDATPAPHLLVAFEANMPRGHVNRLRILPNYRLEGPLYVAYAKRRQARRVFSITHVSAPMEEQFVSIVEPGLTALGAVHRRERIDWNTKDYRTLVLKVKQFQPDLVLLNAFSAQLLPLLSALRAQELVRDGSVFCVLDFVDLLYNATPRSELMGIAFAAPYFEIPDRLPDKAEWVDRYQRRFGQVPHYVPAYAYDTGRILVEAQVRAGGLRPEAIRAATPYRGVTGQIVLDSHGDLDSTLTIGIVGADGRVAEVK